MDDDLIRKNPFQFQLMEVVVNDSVTREAISRAEERKCLRFVKEDPHFCRYYEEIYILLSLIHISSALTILRTYLLWFAWYSGYGDLVFSFFLTLYTPVLFGII